MIEKLSDQVLLSIFRYYLDASPRFWPRLVHICRKWRQIVFASQRALHLRLFCTHGTPVLKALDYWPSLPIVVQYGGPLAHDLPALEDEEPENIMAALRQSDRVCSISLTVTNSLLENISMISEPFLELEELVLLSREGVQLTLPSAFRWGPRLRYLHLTRIAFPALFRLLYSSRNIVDLQLHEVFDPRQVSPEALVNTLSRMVQLRSLSLHFLPTAYHHAPLPRSEERIVLPVLIRLNFRGFAQYFEGLVARIDAPRLEDIKVTFFNKIITNLPKLSEFIDRIEMHKSHHRHAISISLMQPGALTCLQLRLFCESLTGQPFSMVRILFRFFASLFNPQGWDNNVKWFHVVGTLLAKARWRKTPYISRPGPRHPPLREAVLSGHPVGMEYERLCHINELPGTGPFSQRVTIEMLSKDNLLKIFRHCLNATPRYWPTLVLKTLDFFSAPPIFVQYGGSPTLDPPTPEDEDNIIAALKQSDRVSSISLTITTSLLGKLFTIEEPFLRLEELILRSVDNTQQALPSTFRWGTRLRRLHSTRISFLALPQLLFSSENLVDLKLHEIGYFSPEALADGLSRMAQLQSLSLHFLSPASSPGHIGISPFPGERVVLPVLSYFKFRGTSEYLNDLVTRIDAPRLVDIQVRFFNQLIFHISQLVQFIDRIEMQKSHRRVDIVSFKHFVSICFTRPGAPTQLRLRVSCDQLDWQLSAITQIWDQLSPRLSRIEGLGIYTTQLSNGQDDMNREQWLELIRGFGGAEDFRVTGELATDILRALHPADREHTTILPSLRTLGVLGPMRRSFWEAVEAFTSRRPSDHLVEVYPLSPLNFPGPDAKRRKQGTAPQQDSCNVCNVWLHKPARPQQTQWHVPKMCPYCGVFKHTSKATP
ncbi:hypothetical protein EDB87DRAFT_1588593 [Lactarius vividus]|nr:hypothetical protein EDB87DRAFT_1588593 [Lactarius vividus]